MTLDDWIVVPEFDSKHIVGLDKPLADHNAELYDAGLRMGRCDFAAIEQQLIKVRSDLTEARQAAVDLRSVIEENRKFNQQIDEERCQAINSLRAEKSSARNAWSAFQEKNSQCKKLLGDLDSRGGELLAIQRERDFFRNEAGKMKTANDELRATIKALQERTKQVGIQQQRQT